MSQLNNLRISLKIDDLSNWISSDLILNSGEIALIKDTNDLIKIKVGDGISHVSALNYINEIEFFTRSLSAHSANIGLNNTVNNYSLGIGSSISALGQFSTTLGYNASANENYTFVWNGKNLYGYNNRYKSHGAGTFSLNPENGLCGIYIGENTLANILKTNISDFDLALSAGLSSNPNVTSQATVVTTLTGSINVMMMSESDGVWCAATNVGIYRSVDNTKSWTKIENTSATDFASIKALGNGIWLAGTYSSSVTNPGIYRSVNNGLTWSKVATSVVDSPCPWAFATGKLKINNVDTDVVIAGLTQKKGAIYSTDNGLTWNGGSGWTDINTALLDICYDSTSTGLPWRSGTHWIGGGGNNTQNLGGLWYLDETTFKWTQDTTTIGSHFASRKIQALTKYTTKTGQNYLYISETAPDSNGHRYYCDATTCTEITSKEFNSYVYKFVEMADGYLYISPYQNGSVLRITNDGKDFLQYTSKEPKYGQGYTLATDSTGCVLACGYYGSGFGYVSIPILTQLVDKIDDSVSKLESTNVQISTDIYNLSGAVSSDYVLKLTFNTEIADLNATDVYLSNAISSKININGTNVDSLSIVNIDNEEYYQKVIDETLDENALYVISGDTKNAYGQRIENVGDAVEDTDAVNKKYVDSLIATTNSNIENQITEINDNLDLSVNTLTSTINTKISNLSSTVSSNYALKSTVTENVNTLSNAISCKVNIDGENVDSLSIVNINSDDYHQAVIDQTLDENTLYVISDDITNVYGQRIENLGDAVSDTDAVNLQNVKSQINKLSVSYSADHVRLSYDGTEIANFDASQFIVDGMLENAELTNNYLVLSFNTASGKSDISVDLSKYIDVYKAGTGITLSNKTFSVNTNVIADVNDIHKLKYSLQILKPESEYQLFVELDISENDPEFYSYSTETSEEWSGYFSGFNTNTWISESEGYGPEYNNRPIFIDLYDFVDNSTLNTSTIYVRYRWYYYKDGAAIYSEYYSTVLGSSTEVGANSSVNYATKNDLVELNTNIETNTTNITSLTSKVNTNTSNITTLTSKVNTNTSNITTLTSKVNTNTSNITTLTSKVNTNTSNITSLTNTVSSNYTALNSKINSETENVRRQMNYYMQIIKPKSEYQLFVEFDISRSPSIDDDMVYNDTTESMSYIAYGFNVSDWISESEGYGPEYDNRPIFIDFRNILCDQSVDEYTTFFVRYRWYYYKDGNAVYSDYYSTVLGSSTEVGANSSQTDSFDLSYKLNSGEYVEEYDYILEETVRKYEISNRSITTLTIDNSSIPAMIVFPEKLNNSYARDFVLKIVISSTEAPQFIFDGVSETLSFISDSDTWSSLAAGTNVMSFTEISDSEFLVHKKEY